MVFTIHTAFKLPQWAFWDIERWKAEKDHRFYGEKGKGKVLVGEVSMVNDDNTDNCFYRP